MSTAELAMSLVDGCPECVRNTEPPRSAVPVTNGWRTAHLCADCGHAWTTDWSEKALVSSQETGGARERIGVRIDEPQLRNLAVRNRGSTDQTLGA